MKSNLLNALMIGLGIFLSACQPAGPWENFTACGQNHCVAEAMALKDAYLTDPKSVLEKINASGEKGEDFGLGWTYIIRDSVLLHPGQGTVKERLELQKALTNAALPFAIDPKLGVVAKNLVDIWGSTLITEVQASEASQLEGNWISEKDPRYEIRIAGGMFVEYYDGKEQSNAPYLYFDQCPAECNPLVSDMPCIRVDGTVASCYMVVDLGIEVLQLSLIGGNGSTLPFSRKP